jgi:hypothetical protein
MSPNAQGEIGTMDLYVTGVEWRLRFAGDAMVSHHHPQYELVMRVTIAAMSSDTSDAPGGRPSRPRAHKKK